MRHASTLTGRALSCLPSLTCSTDRTAAANRLSSTWGKDGVEQREGKGVGSDRLLCGAVVFLFFFLCWLICLSVLELSVCVSVHVLDSRIDKVLDYKREKHNKQRTRERQEKGESWT